MFSAAKGDELSTIAEIVERFDISRGHVMKVVHRLGRKGYLKTIRGKRGGMRLARSPAEIPVGAVIRDMEEELGVIGCLQRGEGYCRIAEWCELRGALRDATAAFLAVLDRYTLADLLQPRRAIDDLLSFRFSEIGATAPRDPLVPGHPRDRHRLALPAGGLCDE